MDADSTTKRKAEKPPESSSVESSTESSLRSLKPKKQKTNDQVMEEGDDKSVDISTPSRSREISVSQGTSDDILVITEQFDTTTDEEHKEDTEPPRNPTRIVRGQTEMDIEERTQHMVETEAVRSVKAKLSENKTWITITGAPGEGKKKTAYLVMKYLNEMGKDMFVINTPEQYFDVKRVRNSVFLFRDILGYSLFSQNSFERWRPVLDDLRERREVQGLKEDKVNVILLIQRLNVLNSSLPHLGPNEEMIMENVTDISNTSRSDEEKLAVWKSHAQRYDISIDSMIVENVCRMSGTLPFGFPYCCQMFARLRSRYKTLDMKTFFMNPVEFVKESMTPLLNDERIKSVCKEMLKDGGETDLDQLDDLTQKNISELEKIYFTINQDRKVKFIHDSVYDSVALILSGNPTNAVFVVKHCRMSFLKERMPLNKTAAHGDNKLVACPKSTDKLVKAFIERSVDEIINRKNIKDVLSHTIWKEENYANRFMERLSSKVDIGTLLTYEENEMTFLFLAGSSGSRNILKYIWEKNDLAFDEQTEIVRGIFKFDAVEALKAFCEKYSDYDLKTTYGQDLLEMKLVSSNSEDCLHHLRDKGFVNYQNTCLYDGGKTELHIKCENGGNKAEIHSLIEGGLDFNMQCSNNKTPLHYACEHGNAEAVEVLIGAGADINIKSLNDVTPLMYATSGGYTNIIVTLLDKGANWFTEGPNNLLYLACSKGHRDAFQSLLSRFQKFEKRIYWGSLLNNAVRNNNIEMVETLIKSGAAIDKKWGDEGKPVLHTAYEYGNIDIVKLLVKKGWDINQLDNCGNSILSHEFRELPKEDLMMAVIENGLDVNLANSDGETPLHYACRFGFQRAVSSLLVKGADLNRTDKIGRSCLYTACNRDNSSHKIVTLLLRREADVNKASSQGTTPLHLASMYGNVEVIQALVNAKADVKPQQFNRDTALHLLCRNGEDNKILELAKQMINEGADINAMNEMNQQALHGWYRCQYMKDQKK